MSTTDSNSIGIVIPYFGKFPNYFGLWLESCSYNPSIDWLIFTDDYTHYDFPENVKVHYRKFDEIVLMCQAKFDFDINLRNPYKLCDFKPTYGIVFAAYLTNYEFWGFGDMDLIFGNIRSFLTDEILNGHDKIFTHGSFCLLRNTKELNNIFRKKINDKLKFEEVYKNSEHYGFDEYGSEAFNTICVEENVSIYKNNLCFADINSWKKHFELTGVMSLCNVQEREKLDWEKLTKSINSVFVFDEGKLFRHYIKGNTLCKEEYLYVHFQKRVMAYDNKLDLRNKFMMIPNRFVPLEPNIDLKFLNRNASQKFFSNRRIRRQLYIKMRMFLKNYLKI
jgi:hypothetical protein